MNLKYNMKSGSKKVVKNRIIHVLDADRVMCAQNMLEHIQEDIKNTLAKYAQVDHQQIQCQIRLSENVTEKTCPVIIAIVPLKREIL